MGSIFLTEARFDIEKAAGDSYHSVFEDGIFAASDLGSGRGSIAFNPTVGQHFFAQNQKQGTRAAQRPLFAVFEGLQKLLKLINSSPLKPMNYYIRGVTLWSGPKP